MDISKVRKKMKALKADGKVTKEDPAAEESVPGAEDTIEAETGQTGQAEGPSNVTETPPVVDAEVSEEDTVPVEEIELIAFRVAKEEFAVRLSEMQEIMRYQIITRVPRSPEFIQGVTFLRGKVLPVINLKERLSLSGENGERQKIMVMFTSKETVGVLVKKIVEVIRIPETELLPPPATLNRREKMFIRGVIIKGDRFISVLNVNEIAKMENA